MSRRKLQIPKRRPVFLGCEGRSEAGYGALLGSIARDRQDVHLHIDVRVLQPGAGDPERLVERAVQIAHDIERRRSRFWVKAVLIDRGTKEKNSKAIRLATANGFGHLIWQDPDHEAFLLRHLPGCQDRRPAAGASLAALQKEWPAYVKGLTARQLAERITTEEITSACRVEPDLDAFLSVLGLKSAD
jgi:hypothetical protein